MSPLLPAERESLSATVPDLALAPLPDGSSLLSIPSLGLPTGWSAATTPVWFVVPVAYPAAQPDCFWAAADLRLASGATPANTGIQELPGTQEPVLWFSWHLAGWRPAVDDVSTYVRFILGRFTDVC